MILRRRRAVVYGPYPPVPGPASAETLRHTRQLLASGADVRVISPGPSAAQEDADLCRPAGALRFARRAIGVELLVLHLEPTLLTSTALRQGVPARLAVGAALRSAGRSAVYVPGASAGLPAAWARVLAAADEILDSDWTDDEDAAAGPSTDALAADGSGTEVRLGWELPAEPTREELEAEISRRAAQRRSAGRAVSNTPRRGGAAPQAVVRSLEALPLLGPESPRSARLVPNLIKQVVSRLVDWRINPVIEHVNLLHRAVLDAIQLEPQRGPKAGEPMPEPPSAVDSIQA